MVFVYPLFLWAFVAISIPIIIHLFNFRRYKKVYFTNVKFLKALQEESKSRSRLRELLILAARSLVIACLVLAFSQPVIPNENSAKFVAGAKAVSIYVDNSFSMENISKQGPLFEIAKTRAKELINAYGNTDKFQLMTNDFEGKHQRFLGKEDFLNALDDIKISASKRLLSDVIKRQNQFLKGSPLKNKKIYVISDAQKSTFNLDQVIPDTNIRITILPLIPNRVNNVYIDSCWFESPLQQKGFIQKMHATVINAGTSKIEVGTAKLYLNQQQIAISSFSLDPESKKDIQFTFECKKDGFNYGSVRIEDYPVNFDDEFYFAFNSKRHIRANVINGRDRSEENAFSKLLKGDSLFELSSSSEKMIDYSAFKNSDVIILNQLSDLSSGLVAELMNFTKQGGAIVLIPDLLSNLVSYNNLLTTFKLPTIALLDTIPIKTENINLASGFYDGVFDEGNRRLDERMNLPLVNKHFKLRRNAGSDFEEILSLQNRDELFISGQLNNTKLYLFTAPLDEYCSNFTKHALFVPTFYSLSFKSLAQPALSYPVSSNVVISLRNEEQLRDQPPHIVKTDGKTDLIPEIRIVNNSLYLFTQQQISEPGFYEVISLNDRLMPLAFNFSRTESKLSCYAASDLQKIIDNKGEKRISLIDDGGKDLTNQILMGTEGIKLWKLFIILALLFVAAEVALLRFLINTR